jgi:hypothetical protein
MLDECPHETLEHARPISGGALLGYPGIPEKSKVGYTLAYTSLGMIAILIFLNLQNENADMKSEKYITFIPFHTNGVAR